MQVKIIDKCWYNNTLYDPDVMPEDELIIEYTGEKLPSWAEKIDAKAAAKKPAEEGNNNKRTGEVNNTKVSDLPLVEKNALLEEAKAVGIEGNQILSWKVDTLKAKIAAKKLTEEGNDNEKGDE